MANEKKEIGQEQAIATLENHLSSVYVDDSQKLSPLRAELERKKCELETIIECRTKGAINETAILNTFLIFKEGTGNKEQ